MGRGLKCAYLSVVLLMMSLGCATKNHPNHAKLSLAPTVKIRFVGIQDGKCEIGDVFVDAQTKGYVVICKK